MLLGLACRLATKAPKCCRMMVLFAASWFATFVGPAPVLAQPSDLYSDRYVRSVDGLFPAVATIASTPDGFLWFGGQGGLWRFDGSNFERKTEGLGEPPEVRRLMASKDGSLWIATGAARLLMEGGAEVSRTSWRGRAPGLVHRSPQGKFSTPPFVAQLPDKWIWAMDESADGRLWFGTEAGLLSINADGSDARVITTKEGLPNDHITAIAVDGDRVWIGTVRGVAVVDKASVRIVLSDFPTAVLLGRPNRTLFVGGPAGLVVLENGIEKHGRIKTGPVNALLSDEQGKVWIGTVNDLNVMDERTLALSEPLTRSAGVAALGRDREDGLWLFSFERGLLRMGPAPSRSVEPLHRHTIFSVLAARDGTLWTVTTQGVVQLRDGKEIARFPLGSTLGSWAPRSVAETPDGKILIAGGGELIQIDTGVHSKTSPTVNLQRLKPETVFVSAKGDTWLPNKNSGVVRFANSDLSKDGESIGVDQGLCNGVVGPMVEDSKGVMWLGSQAGVGRWDPETRKGSCFASKDGLPGDEISALYIRDNAVLVGSMQPVGLAEIRDGKASAFGLPAPVDALRVFGINEYQGRMWLTSDHGVYVSSPSLHSNEKPGGWRQIGLEDGLPSTTCIAWYQPSLARTSDGRLWVPTLLGLGVLEPTLPFSRPMPRVFAEDVRAGGKSVDDTSHVTLLPGNATFEVRLAAPNFARPDELTFETRMDGVDAQWNPRGGARDTTYAGLSPGKYVFSARLVDRTTGTSGEPIRIDVTALPWWWQRLWFKIAAAMACTAVVALAFVLRGRRIRARFLAISEERARIARDLHDGLAQGFTSITLFVDSAILELQKQSKQNPSQGGRPAEILGATKGIIDQCHREVRQAVFNLRAQEAGRVSVVDAIARVVDATRKTSGAEIAFVVRGKPPEDAADARMEQELPMMVQESLSNALRHGKATKIAVSLDSSESGTRLEIHDNGCGISDAALSSTGRRDGGFGLVGMAERAARVRGKFSVQRASQGGTTVTLAIERKQ
jgi:signal transduction histidine kinase/ligand-binding sensor domain-containing protein